MVTRPSLINRSASRREQKPDSDKNLLIDVAKELLYQERLKNSVRLLGISMHNLNNQESKKNARAETKKHIYTIAI